MVDLLIYCVVAHFFLRVSHNAMLLDLLLRFLATTVLNTTSM
jgi:hypothetical protein